MARRTKAKADATREALLDAAEHVFFERGVARTTLEQIARQAGMTRGAVYWHFKNKADLFHAMLSRVHMPFEELAAEIDEPDLEGSSLEAIRRVCHLALCRLEQPRQRRVLSIVLQRCEFFSDIDPLAMQDRLAEESLQALHQRFAQASDQGQLAAGITPEIASHLLHATLGGLLNHWLRRPQEYSLYAKGSDMVDTLLELLSSSPLERE